MKVQTKVYKGLLDSEPEFSVTALCSKKYCGDLSVAFEHGDWIVANIFVKDDFRRKGVATKLYEAAAKEACKRGGTLASKERLSEGSKGFWEKQLIKGRAVKLGRLITLKDCEQLTLAGKKKR